MKGKITKAEFDCLKEYLFAQKDEISYTEFIWGLFAAKNACGKPIFDEGLTPVVLDIFEMSREKSKEVNCSCCKGKLNVNISFSCGENGHYK